MLRVGEAAQERVEVAGLLGVSYQPLDALAAGDRLLHGVLEVPIGWPGGKRVDVGLPMREEPGEVGEGVDGDALHAGDGAADRREAGDELEGSPQRGRTFFGRHRLVDGDEIATGDLVERSLQDVVEQFILTEVDVGDCERLYQRSIGLAGGCEVAGEEEASDAGEEVVDVARLGVPAEPGEADEAVELDVQVWIAGRRAPRGVGSRGVRHGGVLEGELRRSVERGVPVAEERAERLGWHRVDGGDKGVAATGVVRGAGSTSHERGQRARSSAIRRSASGVRS